MNQVLYLSIDIEADGPIPGQNSMLQLGAAAFRLDSRNPVSTFRANLETLPDAVSDPATMEWWGTQPEAFRNTRVGAEPASVVMPRFVQWCRGLKSKLILVGYPVTYDFMWVYWYTHMFGLSPGEKAPFGFQGLDLKTLAAEKLGIPFQEVSKRRMPREWFKGAPAHTHDALEDAIGQGVLFVNMMS